jgi:hypothetical protein
MGLFEDSRIHVLTSGPSSVKEIREYSKTNPEHLKQTFAIDKKGIIGCVKEVFLQFKANYRE